LRRACTAVLSKKPQTCREVLLSVSLSTQRATQLLQQRNGYPKYVRSHAKQFTV